MPYHDESLYWEVDGGDDVVELIRSGWTIGTDDGRANLCHSFCSGYGRGDAERVVPVENPLKYHCFTSFMDSVNLAKWKVREAQRVLDQKAAEKWRKRRATRTATLARMRERQAIAAAEADLRKQEKRERYEEAEKLNQKYFVAMEFLSSGCAEKEPAKVEFPPVSYLRCSTCNGHAAQFEGRAVVGEEIRWDLVFLFGTTNHPEARVEGWCFCGHSLVAMRDAVSRYVEKRKHENVGSTR